MTRYRCYFLAGTGRLVGAETIECENDSIANTEAYRRFTGRSNASGFELWQGNRQVTVQQTRAS
jgi:hypothetical protein